MLCQGPKGNPPDRPAITHRNEPPEVVAVKPSWEVVPCAPSTTPPPRTAAPDAATIGDARVMSITEASRSTPTARPASRIAIRPPSSRRRGGEGLAPWLAVQATANHQRLGSSRLDAAEAWILLRSVTAVNRSRPARCERAPQIPYQDEGCDTGSLRTSLRLAPPRTRSSKEGATYYAVAVALLRIIEAVVRDQRTVLSVSSVIGNGRHRQSEVCLSLPSIVGARGVEGVLELRL